MKPLLPLLALLAIQIDLRAGTVTQTITIPQQTPTYTEPISVDQLPIEQGKLTAVHIEIDQHVRHTMSVNVTQAFATSWHINGVLRANVVSALRHGSVDLCSTAYREPVLVFALDQSHGPAPVSLMQGGTADLSDSFDVPLADVALYQGTGQVALELEVVGSSSHVANFGYSGNGPFSWYIQFGMTVGDVVTVTMEYDE